MASLSILYFGGHSYIVSLFAAELPIRNCSEMEGTIQYLKTQKETPVFLLLCLDYNEMLDSTGLLTFPLSSTSYGNDRTLERKTGQYF